MTEFAMQSTFGPMMRSFARTFLVETIAVFLGVMGVHPPGHGTLVFLPLTADAQMVFWQARPVHAREPFPHINEFLMLVI